MGEIADMMLDGDLCEGCGEYIGDGGGFPRYCSAQCEKDRGVDTGAQERIHAHSAVRTVKCPDCGKGFKTPEAKAQHWLAKHHSADPA